MKSKTSCFNPGIAKNLLRRFWPLWLGYLLILLLIPFALYGQLRAFDPVTDLWPDLDYMLGNARKLILFLSFGISVVSAMVVFGFLYNTRSCGQFNSLPLTRTSLFLSVFLTGAMAFLAADILACAVTALLCLSGYLSFGSVMDFFAVLVFSKTFFYSFAAFCAMLTGSILILPCVYVVLNFCFIVAELGTRDILSRVIYGLSSNNLHLTWLSPLVLMLQRLNVTYTNWPEAVRLRGMGTAAVYALVGLAFAFIAWRLFRRRRMETAGDTVAIRVLKPVFQYCMCFGGAVVFADLVYSIADLKAHGRNAALILLLLLLLGAFLGYFAARMLIDKTLRVFRKQWRGFIFSAAVIVLLIGACEFDLFGVERYVPKAEKIAVVSIDGVELKEEENIARALELQQNLILHKAKHESMSSFGKEYLTVTDAGTAIARNMNIIYLMKSGNKVERMYYVCGNDADFADQDSDIMKYEELLNCTEALESRCRLSYPMTAENIISASLEFLRIDDEGKRFYNGDVYTLSPEEMIDLWDNGILLDLEEGHIARRTICSADRGWSYTNTQRYLCLVGDREAYQRSGGNVYEQQWINVQIATDSVHCLDWIETHTGVRPTDTECSYANEVYGVG